MNKALKLQNDRGSFLVAAVIIILFLTAIGISLSVLITNQYAHTKRYSYSTNAIQLAEAGIEQTVNKLNSDDDFTGFASPITFFDNNSQGKGIFTTSVTASPDGKSKTIIATGRIFRAGNTNPFVTRKVKVTVVGTSSSGYSVFSGPGGLILGGSANIVNSSVFVGGYIRLKGASKIGTPSDPLDVDVANYQCHQDGWASYPELCDDGTQPISMDWSTHIYGDVCATGQNKPPGPHDNMITDTGLKTGCIAPEAKPPTYDRQAQINAVSTTKSANDPDINCSKWESGKAFTRTWPANLEIVGNVDAASSCDLTITGNVYITGNLDIGGAATIKVADSVGETRPVIIVDGKITVGGSGSMQANSYGTGIEFISFKNSTGDPSANVTGQDLYNSQNQQTIDVGGAANLPGMIFDAYWGKVTIDGSGTIGSAIGQTVDLSGAGTVTFGTALASGTKTWTIRSYQRIYN